MKQFLCAASMVIFCGFSCKNEDTPKPNDTMPKNITFNRYSIQTYDGSTIQNHSVSGGSESKAYLQFSSGNRYVIPQQDILDLLADPSKTPITDWSRSGADFALPAGATIKATDIAGALKENMQSLVSSRFIYDDNRSPYSVAADTTRMRNDARRLLGNTTQRYEGN